MKYTFDNDNEHWSAYEFIEEGDLRDFNGRDIFVNEFCHQSIWVSDPMGSNYIEVGDSMWSEDTPENPHSVLALLHYRIWSGEPCDDIRGKTLAVSLRGDELDLKGALAYFWVMTNSTRYHLITHPLEVSDRWTESMVEILDDRKLWHLSWFGGKSSETLSNVLRVSESFGISFVGFPDGDVPTGRLQMRSLCIE